MIDSYSLSDLKSLSNAELVDMVMNSFENTPELNVLDSEMHSLSESMDFCDFGVIRKHIKVDLTNRTIVYPYVDERERTLYRNSPIKGCVLTPQTGYFIYFFARPNVLPFGLVEVELNSNHIYPNPNNHKHFRFETIDKDTDYYLYNYEKKSFVTVNADDLRFARELYGKNTDKYEKKAKKLPKRFVEREEKINYIRRRLKKESEAYHKAFSDFYTIVEKSGRSIQEWENYLNSYTCFMSDLELGLKIKLIFKRISYNAYKYLIDYIKMLRDALKTIKNDVETLREWYQNRKVDDSVSFDYITETDDERLLRSEIGDKILNQLKMPFLLHENYRFLGFNTETSEVYPNFAILEWKYAKKDSHFSDAEWRDIENEYLKKQ